MAVLDFYLIFIEVRLMMMTVKISQLISQKQTFWSGCFIHEQLLDCRVCATSLITLHTVCVCWQVFEELEEIGKTIQEEVLDADMPVHGAMGGDISKCPYYTAKMGTLLYFSL